MREIKSDLRDSLETALLEAGIVLFMNTFTDQIYYIDEKGEERFLDDDLRHEINLIAHEKKIKVTGILLDSCINGIARKNQYHPVREYLDSLKWDGESRIGSWLVNYMGANNSPYVRAVGRIVLIAAVRRVRQPGCKFDECLIMVGKEGIGKSTCLRQLGKKWFSDSLPLGASPKETVERTKGIWISESAELVGNSPTKIAEIKSFLSRSEDGPYRAAYARHPEMRQRQFICVATTNDAVFLNSTTGNRRFWPVEVYVSDPDIPVDQLWAEASHYEKLGEDIRLDPKLYEAAFAEQLKFRTPDTWEAKLSEIPEEIKLISLPKIFETLGIPMLQQSYGHCAKISQALINLGWEREPNKRHDGLRTTWYVRKNPFIRSEISLEELRSEREWTKMVENNPDPREQELVDMSLKYRFENGMMSEAEIQEYLEKEGQSSS